LRSITAIGNDSRSKNKQKNDSNNMVTLFDCYVNVKILSFYEWEVSMGITNSDLIDPLARGHFTARY